MTYAQVLAACVALGLQLCEQNCKGYGCGYDTYPVWTGLECGRSTALLTTTATATTTTATTTSETTTTLTTTSATTSTTSTTTIINRTTSSTTTTSTTSITVPAGISFLITAAVPEEAFVDGAFDESRFREEFEKGFAEKANIPVASVETGVITFKVQFEIVVDASKFNKDALTAVVAAKYDVAASHVNLIQMARRLHGERRLTDQSIDVIVVVDAPSYNTARGMYAQANTTEFKEAIGGQLKTGHTMIVLNMETRVVVELRQNTDQLDAIVENDTAVGEVVSSVFGVPASSIDFAHIGDVVFSGCAAFNGTYYLGSNCDQDGSLASINQLSDCTGEWYVHSVGKESPLLFLGSKIFSGEQTGRLSGSDITWSHGCVATLIPAPHVPSERVVAVAADCDLGSWRVDKRGAASPRQCAIETAMTPISASEACSTRLFVYGDDEECKCVPATGCALIRGAAASQGRTVYSVGDLPLCPGRPAVLFGDVSTECFALQHDSTCEAICDVGAKLHGNIECEVQDWKVRGVCGPSETPTVVMRAAQFHLRVWIDNETSGENRSGDSEAFDELWAKTHIDLVATTVALILGVSASQVLTSAVPSLSTRGLPGRPAAAVAERQGKSAVAWLVQVLESPFAAAGSLDGVASAEASRWLPELSPSAEMLAREFVAMLRAELASQELNVHQALGSAGAQVATDSGRPAEFGDISMPDAQWLAGEWSLCEDIVDIGDSQDCGLGVRRRDVNCSLVHEAVCEASGPKLPTEEVCEDYGVCPWSFFCPIGRDNTMPCQMQMVSVWMPVALLALAIASWCARFCYRKTRPPTEGRVKIKGLGHARFTIVTGGGIRPADTEVVTAQNNVHDKQQGNERPVIVTTTRKKHIIWHLDDAQTALAKAMLQDDAEEINLHDGIACEVDPASSASSASSESSEESEHLNTWAYRSGERVEYFSSRNGSWLSAHIMLQRLTRTGDNDNEDMPRRGVLYDLRVGVGSQLIRAVPLVKLRSPFIEGDSVEIGVNAPGQGEGEEVKVHWKAATVAAKKGKGSEVNMGYHVRLTDTGRQGRIVVNRVRARFEAGVQVEVYEGPLEGWKPAMVLHRGTYIAGPEQRSALGAEAEAARGAATSAPREEVRLSTKSSTDSQGTDSLGTASVDPTDYEGHRPPGGQRGEANTATSSAAAGAAAASSPRRAAGEDETVETMRSAGVEPPSGETDTVPAWCWLLVARSRRAAREAGSAQAHDLDEELEEAEAERVPSYCVRFHHELPRRASWI